LTPEDALYDILIKQEKAMALRTVRLDDASEQILKELMTGTGKSISTVLKEGLLALKDRESGVAPRRPAEIREEPGLGPGGCAIAPTTELRRGVRDAMMRWNRRR